MRKDKFSLFVLAAEIMGIVWLHSVKSSSEKKVVKAEVPHADIVKTGLLQQPAAFLDARFMFTNFK